MGVGWTGWRSLSLLNSHGSGLSGQLYKVQGVPKMASCLDSLFSSGRSSLGPGVAPQPRGPARPILSPGNHPHPDRLPSPHPPVECPLPLLSPTPPVSLLILDPEFPAFLYVWNGWSSWGRNQQLTLFTHQGSPLTRIQSPPRPICHCLPYRHVACAPGAGLRQHLPGDRFLAFPEDGSAANS